MCVCVSEEEGKFGGNGWIALKTLASWVQGLCKQCGVLQSSLCVCVCVCVCVRACMTKARFSVDFMSFQMGLYSLLSKTGK